MKRKLISLLLCLLVLGSLVLTASAASTLVLDYASLMTNIETQSLEERSAQLKNTYGLDVVILTAPNLYGKSAQAFADDFYDNNGYGEDGVLFLVDKGSRQWHISTSGTAIDLLSDHDLIQIEDSVIPYFSEGRYYDGFCRFQDMLPRLLQNNDGRSGSINFFLSLVLGAVIAGIAIVVMRGTMNTKRPQRSAGTYETEGSYHLRQHQDLFLYSNVSKRPRPQNNSSGSSTHRGSSGSSTHRGSSGRSHGGRGGRF